MLKNRDISGLLFSRHFPDVYCINLKASFVYSDLLQVKDIGKDKEVEQFILLHLVATKHELLMIYHYFIIKRKLSSLPWWNSSLN